IIFAFGHFLRRERYAVVVVEIGASRRHPLETPAHALFELLEFGERGAGDSDEGYVAMFEMDGGAIEVIRPEGAVLASLLPFRREHEMVDGELAGSREQVGQRLLARGPVEHVRLGDPFPG